MKGNGDLKVTGKQSGDRPYNDSFFDAFEESSLRSARAVVPMVLDWIRPKSVVDVGCGRGIWLSVFCEQGVSEVCGFDGDYVDRSRLRIPRESFHPADLSNPPPAVRRFDLAISLEVAEHLQPSSSERFAEFLVSLAPVILFSAAIPEQPGTAHTNPHWHSFWHVLFARRGYRVLDPLRARLWHNEQVSLHYRQNVFLYVKEDWLARDPRAAALRDLPKANCLTLIDEGVLMANLSLRSTLLRLPRLIWQKIARR